MLLEAKVAAQDYLKGRKHVYYLPLYLAANGGDWKSAKSFIERNPSASTARITSGSLTTLMVAARACQWKFARKLLEDLPSKSLETVDIDGRTALHYAAMGGSLETAKALIRKNSALPQIPDNQGIVPLYISLTNKQLLWYLILVTRDEHPCFPFTGPLSDITLYLVRKYPELAFMKDEEQHLLVWLSFRYSDFLSGSNLTFWERWIYKCTGILFSSAKTLLKCLNRLLWKVIEKLAPPLKQVREEKLKHVYAVELVNHICSQLSASKTFEETMEFFHCSPGCPFLLMAAAGGIVEIIRTCLQYFPDLIFVGTEVQSNLLQVAIATRRAKIFNLIKEMPTIALQLNLDMQKSETTLHLAAKLAPLSQLLSVSGSALQMQRELQWLKEVEKITLPGLGSLFFAIASMMVVFGATLSIVLNDQLNLWIRHLSILSEGFANIPSLW
ncbi:hypothetical protein EZV62_007308 [Acer yangbiense]|uniref:Uncharacterized protein n=1 Tax=Acer yangbiense TaxID=1000413 RepID=A0A5C7I8W3_9ROSI|nr:hypothetical protein EZV62_007308 [Acer yangbiense]